MKKQNILVFPCGSEIALEIHRSLKYSTHFNLIGANSMDDHGKFIYENYIGNLPFSNASDFIDKLKQVIKEYNIDIIYPAMDSVITLLKFNEKELNCKVVGSEVATTELCLSKEKTYEALRKIVNVPKIYTENFIYPIFAKPEIGYGSRGAKKINNELELLAHQSEFENLIITEFLPGKEYTVDCFTDRNGNMLFCKARIRNRISNGISVNTFEVKDSKNEFINFAEQINKSISLRGAWFFQVKRNNQGELVLLEIASRLGGSSSLFRNTGSNFAMLSIFDILNYDVEILENQYDIELDRSLDNKYKTSVTYNEVFIDFDDCLLLKGEFFNIDLMKFIFQCINEKIKLTLISRHEGNLEERMKQMRIHSLFDRIIHITDKQPKSLYIDNQESIFIDDSFAERKEVQLNKKISVFSPDMIECLLK